MAEGSIGAPRRNSALRRFLDSEASGGLVLMAAAALAMVVANSPLRGAYFAALDGYVGPLSLRHWINDALMALFFLAVGLEIKREMLAGQLASWSRRILPGVGALGGMAVPALIYVALNRDDPVALRGWAIPTATDIAFALGVMALLGPRVPASLKVFLAALAIIDDLGAVLVIALFYTGALSLPDLALAGALLALLGLLNRRGVGSLLPYLLIGAVVWLLVLRSGVHATVAGVLVAFTIPLRCPNGAEPLLRLETALHRWVAFGIVPIFGFANAGIAFGGIGLAELVAPLTLGVSGGLLLGKLVGVFGAAALAIKVGAAALPMGASWWQLFGTSLLCGIGFTMSLFISQLAFAGAPQLQEEAKIGILGGSLLAGLAGFTVLRIAPRIARAMPVRR